jgi:hypothetical protein
MKRYRLAFIVLCGIALVATACSSSKSTRSASTANRQAVNIKPERIVNVPAEALSATPPQPNGVVWVLAGTPSSKGIFQIDLSTGKVLGSLSVSSAAQSLTETPTGLLGMTIGTSNAGALELMNATTGTAVDTIPVGAPAQVGIAGASGTSIYVLNGNASTKSVTNIDVQNRSPAGTVPVPRNTVSIAVNPQQTILYALSSNGEVSEVSLAGGQLLSAFSVGHSGTSLILGPTGHTLYVLKGISTARNVAIVNLATESVRKVLPAPAYADQVLVSSGGHHLIDLVGTPSVGNLQIYKI